VRQKSKLTEGCSLLCPFWHRNRKADGGGQTFHTESLTEFIYRGKRSLMQCRGNSNCIHIGAYSDTETHTDSSVVYLSTGLALACDSQWLCGCDFLVFKRVFVGEVNHGSFGKLRT
jgi:hypothetical protein